MATYSLETNGLIDSAVELRGVTSSIEAAIADLNSYVAQFIDANVGGAATSYQNAQKVWNEGLVTMRQSLAKGATAIDNIRENYGSADVKGASLFEGNV